MGFNSGFKGLMSRCIYHEASRYGRSIPGTDSDFLFITTSKSVRR